MRIILACRTRFHAFSVASELDSRELLKTFYTTAYVSSNSFLNKFTKRRDSELIRNGVVKQNLLLLPFAIILPNTINNILFDLCVAFRLIFNKNNYDVLHCWSGMSFWSILVARYQKKIIFLERSSTHIIEQERILKNVYKSLNKNFRISEIIKAREIKEYELASNILVPSKFVESTFIKNRFESEKLYLNNFGSNILKPSYLKKEYNDEINILYLGGFSARKGAALMKSMWLKIIKNKLKINFKIIGKVDEDVKEIKYFLEDNGVCFTGHIAFVDLLNSIKGTHFAIQPSFEEGLSMVIPQLMSYGIPVIASESSGGADIIDHGKTGFIFNSGDVNKLYDIIYLLYNDHNLISKISSNCFKQKNIFSWKNYGDRYEKLLLRYKK